MPQPKKKYKRIIDNVIYRHNAKDNVYYVDEVTWDFNATSLTLQDSIDGIRVKYIAPQAFKNCFNLEHIVIPSSIDDIRGYVFEDCRNLKTVTFDGSKSTSNTSMPSISIYVGAFGNCKNLRTVSSPYPIQLFHDVFANCRSLERIDAEVFGYLNGTFKGCTSLQRLVLDGTASEINVDTFSGCKQPMNLIFKRAPKIDPQVLPTIAHMNIYVSTRSKLWELSYEGYKIFPLKDAPQ